MDLFEFADTQDETPEPTRDAPASLVACRWEWWDPMPAGLTTREQLTWQVRRDVRALRETGDAFFVERIASYRAALREQEDASTERAKSTGLES